MSNTATIPQILKAASDTDVALSAPGQSPLTHAQLRRHIEAVVQQFAGFGIGRGVRVAIVLPNGPAMASAFLGVAAAASAAPLNPAYRAEEFDFFLSDLGAAAVIVDAGDPGPVAEVARAKGIPLIALSAGDGAAGLFELSAEGHAAPVEVSAPVPGDEALVLHTSGTTSRPKIVPLSHANLCASARNIRATLQLTHIDRCLNVMPLFHIHGLMAATLASLSAGGSVFCAPGFDALRFYAWLAESEATWYTAVPTMHQTILGRAPRNADRIAAAKLRMIRSSSAALAPTVFAELEAMFGVPVIESYGMTEAAHQMASNPLPPGERKPGTVGPAAGPDIALLDEKGRIGQTPGAVGEVVFRGDNITAGYENNPAANAEGFTGGWFRTGDQGVLDDDGYLTITGRLKEIINRGGEKISPREVDEVLIDCPGVAQAVTFALPHPKLGEDVAAAVVLAPDASATERGIRDYAAQRLAPFKVPRKIVILDEIPRGPTGKLQRIGLAKTLGLIPAQTGAK
jgi:acyl-CoA synthetase (AMP-forming)/AMP-acid ligase II